MNSRGVPLHDGDPAGTIPASAIASLRAREDAHLIRQIERGDADAFEELYDRFHARAHRVAWSVCRDDGRAEEAVQESFVSIWRHAATYRAGRGAVAGWLLALVRHRAIDVARENGRHARNRAGEEGIRLHRVPGVMADSVIDRDEAGKLTGLLRRLPDAQQEVIALAFYGQLTHAEIAAYLAIPPGTVKGRMRLGLEKLRVDIDENQTAERWHEALTRAFLDGDLEEARRIVADAGNEMPVVSMLDDVLAPAMHSIGALWQNEQITIADEHLATSICHRLLAEIAGPLKVAPAGTRETVLLLTPASERHTFGLLMAHDVLHGAGYRTVLLGGEIPDRALVGALTRHRPAIVALSSTMTFPGSFAERTSLIGEILPSAQVIAGGAATERLPGEFPVHHVARLDGLLAKVDAMLGPRRG